MPMTADERKKYQRQWRIDNADRVQASRQRWADKQTPEQKRARYERQRDAAIARATRWATENPDRRSEINRRYSQKPEIQKTRAQQKRAWARANPDKLRAYRERYRQWDRTLLDLDDESYEHAMVLYADPCAYCGAPAEHIDHIEPVSAGGINHWDNLTAACASCNKRKHAKPVLRFMLDRRG